MNFKFWTKPIALMLLILSTHTAYAGNDSDDDDDDDAPRSHQVVAPGTKYDYANLSAEDKEILNNGRVSKGQYIAGGIVGSLVGFGIGQAIEGRYMPTGLIITAGEVASLALLVSGVADCVNNNLFTYNDVKNSSCSNSGAFTVGVIGLVGFRIWEIVDVWASPIAMNNRYDRVRRHTNMPGSAQFYAAPVTHLASNGSQTTSGVFGVQFHF